MAEDDWRSGEPFAPAGEAAAAWRWQGADRAGVAFDGATPRFASQQAAEDWLAEHFQELADQGVAAVTLFDGERVVYGPMPLDPA
jgi:hypothetical protein